MRQISYLPTGYLLTIKLVRLYSERHKNKTLLLGGFSIIDMVMIRFIKKLPFFLLFSSRMA